eukprot:SAG11_NODE_3059_length_2719_cov_1.506870_1_plen_92_part_10
MGHDTGQKTEMETELLLAAGSVKKSGPVVPGRGDEQSIFCMTRNVLQVLGLRQDSVPGRPPQKSPPACKKNRNPWRFFSESLQAERHSEKWW